MKRDLQLLVTESLIEERQCGRVRTIPVSIVNTATGEKIDECPQPHELKDLLDDLWLEWLPDVPRRTVERDMATLVKKRALRTKGESKARVYAPVSRGTT